MPGIAAAQFGPHGGVAGAPKALEVVRHLYRSAGRRQQMHEKRHAAVAHRRRGARAEHPLKLPRQHRYVAAIVDEGMPTAWHLDVSRREAIEVAPLTPVQAVQ